MNTNWTGCPTVMQPRSLAIHPKDPRTVVASGNWQIWLSRDGSGSCTDVTRNLGDRPASGPQTVPHTQCLEFDPAGARIFACTETVLWFANLEGLK